jgi:hypothetical protein
VPLRNLVFDGGVASLVGCVADSGCHERITGGRRVTRTVKWLEGSGVIVVRLDFVWLCFAMGTALVGCASIQQQNVVSTAVGQSLTAGIGDVVLRVEGRESMPNAFGRADLFGRTRPTGFTTIQYGGMQGDKIVLLRGGLATRFPRLYHDEQHASISPDAATNDDVRERRLSARCNDGYYDWDGLYPANRVNISYHGAAYNSDCSRLAQQPSCASSGQNDHNRNRHAHFTGVPDRVSLPTLYTASR